MDMSKMYNEVFKDAVRCYIEEFGDYEDKPILSEEEIGEIAYKMIYKNDYIWEVINSTIDMYIGNILNERGGKENE